METMLVFAGGEGGRVCLITGEDRHPDEVQELPGLPGSGGVYCHEECQGEDGNI